MERTEQYFYKLICWFGTNFPENAFSTVVLAIITSCAGAYMGGRAAQIVSERNKMMNNIVREMRANNASISLTFSIINTLLNMKEQYIKPLKESFDATKAEFEVAYVQKNTRYSSETPYTFPADLRTLEPPTVPIERLQKMLFEETSITGRPLTLVSFLAQTIHLLSHSLSARNNFINAMNAAPAEDKINLPFLYFGKRLTDGNVDERYPSLVAAIYKYTDDCIMFCKFLTEDLEKHGKDLTEKHKKRFGKHLPKVHKADFSIAENKRLLPDEADYESFKNSFKKHDEDA
ncbi:MAG: hypothetical protein ABID63_15805 [Pseudomonadota bacterium]